MDVQVSTRASVAFAELEEVPAEVDDELKSKKYFLISRRPPNYNIIRNSGVF